MTAKRAVVAARRATDKRTTGTAKNPKVVPAASASSYKPVKPTTVTKKTAGRHKKPK